ncbi:MAG: hypothetical protein ACLSC5_04485 [Acutalibacteraceae bacterium]|jgi:hypothetical protein
MKEYITVLTESKWVNGSGWSYSTVNNTFESDTFDADAEIDWDDILCFDNMDEETIKNEAEGDPEDIQWTLTTYKAADYDENGSEATPLAEVEKWNSEAASEYLERIAD